MINNRRNYLKGLPEMNTVQPVIATPSHVPAMPTSLDDVTITVDVAGATSVNLWWNTGRAAFRRTVMNPAGANRYSALIPAQSSFSEVHYYIEAIAPQNVARYNPERAEKEFFRYTTRIPTRTFPVVINEVMPGNTSTIQDPQGQYDDWVELYNTSSQSVDIGNLYLSDGLTKRTRWKIPEGTRLQGNEYILIWADNDSADSPGLHTNFKLSKSGEGVFLFDTDVSGNALLDSVSFGEITAGITWGRYPNGTGPFRLLKPTPGAFNQRITDIPAGAPVPASFDVTLYPNPVAGRQLSLQMSLPVSGTVHVSVFDMLGRLTMTLPSHSASGGMSVHVLDIHALNAGTYVMHFDMDGYHRQTMFSVAK